MKTKILLSLLICSKFIFAQEINDKIIYLDSANVVTSEPNHVYYRIVKDYKLDKPYYYVTQYYRSGKKESEGISISKEVLKRKGVYTSYYEDESKKIIVTYDDKGYKEGNCMFWYQNGDLKFEGVFIKSTYKKDGLVTTESTLKITNYWDSNKLQTVINGNGDYKDDGYFDFINDQSISSGKLINGYKDGLWLGSNDKLGITFSENYTNGKLISGKSTDSNNREYLYNVVAIRAESKEGIIGFYKYIAKNVRIPENIRSGKVYTQFTVTSKGDVVNVEILEGLRGDIDQEIIRVVSNYKDFNSAKFRGVNVKNNYSLPISIQSTE